MKNINKYMFKESEGVLSVVWLESHGDERWGGMLSGCWKKTKYSIS